MNKKQKIAELNRLMQMTPPSWLTKEIYEEFLNNRDTWQKQFQMSWSLVELLGSENAKVFTFGDGWDSVDGAISPKFLFDKYLKGELISDPTTGQDPKTYSVENVKIASKHAGNQWGYKKKIIPMGNDEMINTPSAWISFGTFNLIKIGGKLCITPINVEHRLWAFIAFPMNLITLASKHSLWFYHQNLPPVFDSEIQKMVRGIRVNDMYLSDIVAKCNELGATDVTEDTIKNRFFENKFKFSFLPFFSQKQTEEYFAAINDSSSKTVAQIFHAESHHIQYWVKEFSSVKVTKFTPCGKHLHPVFETMKDGDLVKLEPLMISHTILQKNIKGGYIPHSDKALVSLFYENKNKVTDEIKKNTISDLNWLDSVLSKSETPLAITKQLAQHFLKIRDYLDDSNRVIADKALFIDEWNKWFASKGENQNNGQLTEFAGYWRKSTIDAYTGAWGIIFNEFINRNKEVGIVTKSPVVPRLFSDDVVYDSYIKHNRVDVDAKLFTTKPVGGHMISDMELIRMTPDQRNQAFIDEGIGDTFDFNKNCRAMSSYHNNRMGVLRLSEYLPIINDDKKVIEARIKKYNELKQKEILV
jgi:hypothetical protein